MAYWLVKSEPSTYGWETLFSERRTVWDGVRNFAARNFLKEMQKGDLVFFYHSNDGKEIVGIAKVMKTAYQDPTTEDANWVVVDIAPVKKLKHPVTLHQIREDGRLKNMALLRLSRLSVQPVSEEEWQIINKLSEKA